MSMKLTFDEYVMNIADRLNARFRLSPIESSEVLDYYADDIVDGFSGERYVNIDTLINGWVVDNKLKWKA